MKIRIVIVIIILMLTGCDKDGIKYSELPINFIDEQIIIDDTDKDPLVVYALDNLTFKFKSDDGHYNRWWTNDDYVDDEAMLNFIEILTNYINNGDFEILRNMILTIPDYNKYIKEIKINYIVPILMSEGNYEDALRIVQKKYDFEWPKSSRFRFDSLYLQRYLYLNNGLEYSMEIIDTLREEYPSRDLSYVWFAISEKNYYDLYSNGISLPLDSLSKDYELLHYIIVNHPNDPFIDHAYYFMGDYDKIISDYPDSDIYERAKYAKAYVVYHDVWSYKYYHDPEAEIDMQSIDLADRYFKDYLNDYVDSEFSNYAVKHLLTLYTSVFRNYGDDTYYYDLISFISETERGIRRNKMEMMNYIAYIVRREYIRNETLIDYNETLKNNIEMIQEEAIKDRILTGIAHNAFDHNALGKAVDIFNAVDYKHFDHMDKHRIETLYELSPFINKDDKESLFKIAEILRDNNEYELSLTYYDQLLELDLEDEERSKVYMLKASSYREVDAIGNMVESYQYITEYLEETQFADDALAEIGVYYLLYKRNTEKAREIFNAVIEKYPNTNAINNSYNWIAWSYLQDENYKAALEAYEALRDKFPFNRLGINARLNIKKLNDKFDN